MAVPRRVLGPSWCVEMGGSPRREVAPTDPWECSAAPPSKTATTSTRPALPRGAKSGLRRAWTGARPRTWARASLGMEMMRKQHALRARSVCTATLHREPPYERGMIQDDGAAPPMPASQASICGPDLLPDVMIWVRRRFPWVQVTVSAHRAQVPRVVAVGRAAEDFRFGERSTGGRLRWREIHVGATDCSRCWAATTVRRRSACWVRRGASPRRGDRTQYRPLPSGRPSRGSRRLSPAPRRDDASFRFRFSQNP